MALEFKQSKHTKPLALREKSYKRRPLAAVAVLISALILQLRQSLVNNEPRRKPQAGTERIFASFALPLLIVWRFFPHMHRFPQNQLLDF